MMRGKRGQVQIDVLRDRDSFFEPQLVKKGQTRFDGLDKKVISLYARGVTQREIQGYLVVPEKVRPVVSSRLL